MSLLSIKHFASQTYRSVRCLQNIRIFNIQTYSKSSRFLLKKYPNYVNNIFNHMFWGSLNVQPYQLNTYHLQYFSTTSATEYEQIAEETLQGISEYFEDILEESSLNEWDVSYSNGVLTVSLENHGIYVLNKQSPNKQIWLSSPISGPKRYDYVNGKWIYKRDGISLNDLLTKEISKILGKEVSFLNSLSGN